MGCGEPSFQGLFAIASRLVFNTRMRRVPLSRSREVLP
jgi:hypothetical protein